MDGGGSRSLAQSLMFVHHMIAELTDVGTELSKAIVNTGLMQVHIDLLDLFKASWKNMEVECINYFKN